jgi:hypothetical protein
MRGIPEPVLGEVILFDQEAAQQQVCHVSRPLDITNKCNRNSGQFDTYQRAVRHSQSSTGATSGEDGGLQGVHCKLHHNGQSSSLKTHYYSFQITIGYN